VRIWFFNVLIKILSPQTRDILIAEDNSGKGCGWQDLFVLQSAQKSA
jgi:hypothetical protein